MASSSITGLPGKSIWGAFGNALRAELREQATISGFSGIEHAVEAIAVDDKGKRLIVVSAEPNPRIAALMQVDVQATLPDVRVLVARPIAFDIAHLARNFVQQLGSVEIRMSEITKLAEQFKGRETESMNLLTGAGGLFEPIARTFKNLTLPPLNQIIAAIQQLAQLDWKNASTGGSPAEFVMPLANVQHGWYRA